MADSIENRIVSINFDNKAFQQKMTDTIASLDALKKSLDFANQSKSFDALGKGADGVKKHFDFSAEAKSLDSIGRAAQNVNLTGIATAVDHIANRFSMLGAVAFTVIQNLTNQVLNFTKGFVEVDVLGSILTGGKQRAQNIQQAQFMFRALGMDVDKSMQSAREAVLGTAYGLGDAAKAAAQFGASGVKSGKQMTQYIQAIAGAAAMTGTGFTEMAQIFTSSAAMGKVTNQDLMQFATRGLNAAAAVGKQLGKTETQVHEMATAGELDFNTFATAMYKAFGPSATRANELYTGALANMHAAMSRLGAKVMGPQLFQLRDIFNALTPAIDKTSTALTPLIDTFTLMNQLGTNKLVAWINNLKFDNFAKGMKNISDGLVNIWKLAMQFKKIIIAAFRDVFPKSTTSQFVKITAAFKEFTTHLKMGADTVAKFRSVFAGMFAAFDIAWTIFKELVKFIVSIVKAISPAIGGLLSFSAGIGDVAVNLQEILVTQGGIHKFFEGLKTVLIAPIAFLKLLVDKIREFFGMDFGDNRISSRLQNLGDDVNKLQQFWDAFNERMQGVYKVFQTIWDYISSWFSELGQRIADTLKPGDFNAILDIINTALFGGLVAIFARFVHTGLKINIVPGLGRTLRELSGVLEGMQAKLKAQALMEIAKAIALLTAALVILSLIDSAKLTKALAAVSVSMGQLIGSLALLNKIGMSGTGVAKLSGIGTAMIIISSALVIFAAAVKLMSTMDAGELAKGLAGITAALAAMTAAAKVLSGNAGGIFTASVAMIAMATALNLLLIAIKGFSMMSWQDMSKGLLGVGLGLGLLVTSMEAMEGFEFRLPLIAAAMILMAVAINILAAAVAIFATMEWDSMAKGLLGVALGLGVMVTAMDAMSEFALTAPIGAAALIMVATALNVMATAIKLLSTMSLEEISRGLLGVALGMGVMITALDAISGTGGLLTAAIGITLISGSLLLLAHALKVIGELDISQIAIGLGTIAASLAVLGVAAYFMDAVTGALLALGVGLAVIGGAFALFGLGVMLVAKGFEILAKSGEAGAKAFVGMVATIATASTEIGSAMADAFLSFVEGVLKDLPVIVRLFQALLEQILVTVIREAPKIAKALAVVITSWLALVRAKTPDIIATGFFVLIEFMKGIRDNIYEISNLAADILINFMSALTQRMPELVAAGSNLIVSFLEGLAQHAGEIVAAGAQLLAQFLQGIAQNLGSVVGAVFNIITTFITEMGKGANRIVTAGTDAMISFIQGLGSNAIRLANAAGQAIVDFLNGLAKAIDTYAPQIRDAGLRVIGALINGMTFGLASKIGDVMNWFKGLGGKIIGWVGNLLSGPMSLVGKGMDVIWGFFGGIGQIATTMKDWFGNLGGFIFGWIGDVSTKLWNVGVSLVVGLWRGLSSMAGWLKEKVGGFVSDVKDWMGVGWKIVGDPYSIVFMRLGGALSTGLAMGIDDKSHLAEKSISSLANQVSEAFNPDISAMNLTMSKISDLSNLKSSVPTIIPTLNISPMKSAIAEMKNNLGSMDESNPTITPYLDLSSMKSGLVTITNNLDSINDLNPTITPIVNLSSMKSAIAEAKDNIGSIDKTNPTVIPVVKLSSIKAAIAEVKDKLSSINQLDPTITPIINLSVMKSGLSVVTNNISSIDGLNPTTTPMVDLSFMQSAVAKVKEDLNSIDELNPTSTPTINLSSMKLGLATVTDNLNSIDKTNPIIKPYLDLSSMKAALAKVKDNLGSIDDFNPTITPVLDLSKVKSQANTIGEYLKIKQLTPKVSIDNADLIAKQTELARIQAATPIPTTENAPRDISFTQINNSPKALSTADIYRNTRSQIALAKEELGIS